MTRTAAPTIPKPRSHSRLTPEERAEHGKRARVRVPRASHAAADLPAHRPDMVGLLEGQAQSRVPDLVPVRYGRMLVSPFTYYRGAALPMASDLATTPVSGFTVQACGDAHLSKVPDGMRLYGAACGWTLARAHAKSGDRIAIAAYLGGSDEFDQAIADYATAYADHNERDYQALAKAASTGRITVQRDLLLTWYG